MDIKDIIQGCKDRNRYYQKMLYDKYSTKMFGVCIAYAKDKEAAQDILHDGFFKIFKKIGTFQGDQNKFEAWMRRVIVNTALDYLKRVKRLENRDLENSAVSPAMIDNELSEKVDLRDITEIIRLLPDGARTIFNLYSLEGYKHKEIAEMLDISEGTSKSQFSRAKSLLQDLMKKYYL